MEPVFASFSSAQILKPLNGGGYGSREEDVVEERDEMTDKHVIRKRLDHFVCEAAGTP